MKTSVRSATSVIRVCLSFTLLMIVSLSTFQLKAQQNPYPFNLDLSLGGGLIGNPDVNTTFQPEAGFSYMPGRFGIGLNAGILSYDPTFDTQQYTTGFEEYTTVSGSNEKWSSFFFGVGPRFEFGNQLPVTFRSSLDLSLTYNSPPSVSVDFSDPDGAAGDLQLQLSGYDAGDDYSKWSAAIRPEFQMQFSPGGSDRFAITVATGIQHRLSQNEFTYSQRDLSEVRIVPNSREMFIQFEMAPEIQQSAQPPKTNFFTTVGLKIKFGTPKGRSAPAQDYNAARSNKPTSRAGDIGDFDPDSDGDGLDDAIETAQDYNAARSNKPTARAGDIGDGDADSDGDGIDDGTEKSEDCDDDDSRLCGETDHLSSSDIDDDKFREAFRMARIINPLGIIISAGKVLTSSNQSPGHIEAATEAESNLYEGLANNGDSDNNNNEDPAPVNRYDLQPVSYCVSLSIVPNQVLKTFFESGDKPAAPQYDGDSQIAEDESLYRWGNNELRVCHIEEILTQEEFADLIDSYIHRVEDGIYFHVDGSKENVYCWGNNELRECPGEKTKTQSQFGNLIDSMVHRLDNGGDSGGTITVDLPEMMKSASFSISKRSARTERNGMNDGDLDGDGYGDVDGLHFELEIDPLDEDSDGDGVVDAIESASYSISKRSARTGRSATSGGKETDTQMAGDDDPCGPGVWARTTGGTENCSSENSGQENPLARESGWQETPALDVAPPSDVYQWTYKLNELSGGEELPGNGTLTVLFTGGNWHFDVQLDPDNDGDGYGDLLKNSSFSISKRSARTGRVSE